MYGDSWLDTAYAPVVEAFRASGQPALMTVFRNEGQWDTSNVWFENGRIRLYDKRERLPQMQHIDWGLGMVRADALAARPANEPFDLAEVYSDLSRAGQACRLRGHHALLRDRLGRGPASETDALLRNGSELVARGLSVVVEHLHGFERILVHVLADQRQLLDDVVGHRDDLAADLVGLENVEQFARARPDQFGVGRGFAAASPIRP